MQDQSSESEDNLGVPEPADEVVSDLLKPHGTNWEVKSQWTTSKVLKLVFKLIWDSVNPDGHKNPYDYFCFDV
jgi:hypothetical protein